MRFRFIEDRRGDYPVTIMCSVLDVSPAGYYAWRTRSESRRSVGNRTLLDDIKRVHRDNHGCYGSPRIHRELEVSLPSRCPGGGSGTLRRGERGLIQQPAPQSQSEAFFSLRPQTLTPCLVEN